MTTARDVLDRIDNECGVTQVYDRHGSRLVVGSRIAATYYNDKFWPGGVVTEITDPDGDVTDEGRAYSIDPTVTVVFDNGDFDTYTTFYTGSLSGAYGCAGAAEFECEDVDRDGPLTRPREAVVA